MCSISAGLHGIHALLTPLAHLDLMRTHTPWVYCALLARAAANFFWLSVCAEADLLPLPPLFAFAMRRAQWCCLALFHSIFSDAVLLPLNTRPCSRDRHARTPAHTHAHTHARTHLAAQLRGGLGDAVFHPALRGHTSGGGHRKLKAGEERGSAAAGVSRLLLLALPNMSLACLCVRVGSVCVRARTHVYVCHWLGRRACVCAGLRALARITSAC